MIRKTVEFSTPGTRLSVANSQFVVERPDLPTATLPIEDLGVVIVDDIRATYTQSVMLSLLERSPALQHLASSWRREISGCAETVPAAAPITHNSAESRTR